MKVADIKVDYINHCGDDLSTVNAARVSFDKESDWEYVNCKDDSQKHEQLLEEGWFDATDYDRWDSVAGRLPLADVKLIHYLAKHKHKSPFNHAFISVRVKAPVFVARQLVKHKFMPWNEVSRRYVDSPPEFYFPEYWRAKAENVKQGSDDKPMQNEDLHYGFSEAVERSYMEYSHLLSQDVCAEQARMVLPQSVMTEWIWSGTLGAFADMLVLRLSPYTQAETRIVAEQVRDIVAERFPVSLKALLEHS